MRGLNKSPARGSVAAVLLVVIVALLTAVLLAGQVAEAQRGGGGRGGGGGGGKPPSGAGKSSSGSNSSAGKSGDKGLPSGVANPNSPYYNSPNYGLRHGVLSNFFLWSWLFHDFDDEEYEEEYIESNTNFEGWVITGVGIVVIWFLIRNLRRRFGG